MVRKGTPRPETQLKTTPKRYRVKQWNPMLRRSKPTGFRRLYVYYLIFLGVNRQLPGRKTVPFAVRQEVIKLRRYQKQFRLMQEYRIDDSNQLSMLQEALQAEIDALTNQRKGLYRQKRKEIDVSQSIESINRSLRQLRQKLKLCDQITADIPRIREQVQQSREPQEEKSQKQNKKFSIYERGK